MCVNITEMFQKKRENKYAHYQTVGSGYSKLSGQPATGLSAQKIGSMTQDRIDDFHVFWQLYNRKAVSVVKTDPWLRTFN